MELKRLLIAFTIGFILLGCQRMEKEDDAEQEQIVLGAVSDAVLTRALTTSPLKKDYRFRLYIFPNGETDPVKIVATRTYTITDDAGTPTLDAGQKPIKVAQDDYDFYIVGPLMGVDDKGVPVEIASEVGVHAYAGNDIVSSLTKHTVGKGVNNIQPTPLSHRMAKMQVVIERPVDATYIDLRVDEILLFNQPVKGDFTFGADGGSVTAGETTATRKYAPPIKETDDRYTATDYLFGQPQKDVKIETTFDAKVYVEGVLQVNTYYGQSGSVKTDIVVGNSYEIKANPLVPTELLWRLNLVPWRDQQQGSTSSDDRQLVALFSGMDAPLEINGKKYWRDRSGNDNHGEIVGSVIYNTDDKYYTATQDEGSFIQLPVLGEMKDITVELVLSSTYNGKTTPFHASGKDGSPQANMHVPHADADLYLDWGDPDVTTDRIGPTPYRLNDFGFYEGMSTWQYTRKVNVADVTSAIYHEGELIVSDTKALRSIDFEDVKFLCGGNSVTKLYGVRIYRKVLTPDQMTNNAKNDKAIYAKISTDDHGKYVQKGLILDLQGEDVPSTSLVQGRKVWQDRSMFGNHAELLNGGPVHVTLKKGYQFAGGNSNRIMQLLRGLGDLSGCTIELVMTAGTGSACDNLNFMDRTGTNVYTFGGPNVKFSATFPGVTFKVSDATTYSPELTHTWSMVRNPSSRTITLYQNGYAQVTSDISQQRSVPIPNQSLNLSPVTVAQIGGKLGGNLTFNGLIHAIRVYNRPLNDTERHMNYELDKKKYNMPSSSQYLPPVKGGLIFCYDGRRAPKTVGAKRYWTDEVAKNDAEFVGTVNYNATNKFYSVDNNYNKNYMQMLYTVAMHNNFTAEFILRQDAIQSGSPIYWGTDEDKMEARYLFVHIPYIIDYTGGHRFYVDSPGLDRYDFPWPYGGTNYYNERRKIVIRRKDGKSEVYMCNKKVGEGAATTDMSTKVCTVMDFGGHGWGGEFYIVRYYDRALSDEELTSNYEYDDGIFNLIER